MKMIFQIYHLNSPSSFVFLNWIQPKCLIKCTDMFSFIKSVFLVCTKKKDSIIFPPLQLPNSIFSHASGLLIHLQWQSLEVYVFLVPFFSITGIQKVFFSPHLIQISGNMTLKNCTYEEIFDIQVCRVVLSFSNNNFILHKTEPGKRQGACWSRNLVWISLIFYSTGSLG